MARPKSNTAQIIAAICACITVMVLLHNQFGNPDKTSSSDTTNSEKKDQSNAGKSNKSTNLIERNHTKSVDISGVWKCRKVSSPNSSRFNRMKIKQSGNKIKVIGIGQDWSGEGVFDGSEGYYDWKFKSGNEGRTTIYIDSDGNLFGDVKGQITPWTYIGTR